MEGIEGKSGEDGKRKNRWRINILKNRKFWKRMDDCDLREKVDRNKKDGSKKWRVGKVGYGRDSYIKWKCWNGGENEENNENG